MKRIRRWILLFAVFGNPVLFAQVDRANVTGTIHDPTGAAVGGATITVTYPATGVTRSTTSNEVGVYFIASLPVGAAVISVVDPGFRTIRAETDLKVGETKTLDFSFELANIENSVEVVADQELARNMIAIGSSLDSKTLSEIPINGRNWGNLMALTPGAVDTGAGNGTSVRFLGRGPDDNNYRVDGVDATSVRNQTQSKSRLLISTDAISEFRVSSGMYTAETGGAPGGQVEIVSKAGANEVHGSIFEYFRNSALDSRSPFDGARLPPFRLNQFGGTAGGPLKRDRTFFFASYEGLVQSQGQTQIGFVPSDSFRAGVAPALKPILDVYPEGQKVVNASVMQWTGVASATQNEHVGLIRVDHRFTDKLSGYFRFSKNSTDIFAPNSALPVGTHNFDAPTSGLFDFLYLASPVTTNELRIGANYSEPLHSRVTGGPNIAVSVPSLSSLPAATFRIAFGLSQSIVDQWSTLHGAHTFKAGVELRRVQLIIHDGPNAQAGTLTYASLPDFQANKLTTVEYSSELPTKQVRKIGYFPFFQDEWKVKSNLTATLGLRYEYYGVFSEIHNREIPFDISACGGYCAPGSRFNYPDRTILRPEPAWRGRLAGTRERWFVSAADSTMAMRSLAISTIRRTTTHSGSRFHRRQRRICPFPSTRS
jgi:outer membrane receptor protein involved in Fe transport